MYVRVSVIITTAIVLLPIDDFIFLCQYHFAWWCACCCGWRVSDSVRVGHLVATVLMACKVRATTHSGVDIVVLLLLLGIRRK